MAAMSSLNANAMNDANLWSAVQAIGSIVAIVAATVIAGFQHWSNHQVEKARARARIDRLAKLCELVVEMAQELERAAGVDFDSSKWAWHREDKARLSRIMKTIDGVDYLELPNSKSMSCINDFDQELRYLIQLVELLALISKEKIEAFNHLGFMGLQQEIGREVKSRKLDANESDLLRKAERDLGYDCRQVRDQTANVKSAASRLKDALAG